MSGTMLPEVTSENIKEILKTKEQPFLVFIWAPWCSNCKALKPVMEELSNEQGDKFQIVKLNGDENKEIIQRYKVFGLPTTLIFSHGLLVDRKTGMQSKKALTKRINSNRGLTQKEAESNEITSLFRWPFKKAN